MAELPHSWRAYARLQHQVGQNNRADARAWAIETGLDHLLNSVGATAGDESTIRTVATARRREVYRNGALRRHAKAWNGFQHPEAAIHARLTLETFRKRMTGSEWDILCDVGAGWSYDEIAKARGGTPGGYRVRILRLRRALAA